MNNFNDYYNYPNVNYNDMNFMTDPNNMIYDMNYQNTFTNTFMMPSTNNNNILDTKLGFKRGNIFNNLYDEYKNYKPQELKASSEREDLLLQIDEQRFAMIEMNLYLDLYPNDKSALSKFNTYLKKEKELVAVYESKYGPLTIGSPTQTNNWLWDNSPWPWEVQN